uniref:Apple domain-containing protein n=1 Tax=Angiostrongylus cantonensis TaxID=6313 RepID=A0A0K0DQK0_ANGCA
LKRDTLLHFLVFAGYEFLSATKCFSFTPSHGISNSISFVELFRVTVGDCLNYCIINAAKMGDGCVSVVYHKLHSTCQLYGHNGYFNGSKVVPANAHDFYQRTSWTGFCQDKVGNFLRAMFCQLFQCQKGLISNVPCSTLFLKNLPKGLLFMLIMVLQELLQNPISTCLECPKQEKLSYFVVFGYRLSIRNLAAELKGIDQSSCVMYCSLNIVSDTILLLGSTWFYGFYTRLISDDISFRISLS